MRIRGSIAPAIVLSILVVPCAVPRAAGPARDGWPGIWTWDLCHEDRKGGHEAGDYCREGLDRLVIDRDAAGRFEITRCPSLPWRESNVRLEDGGRTLRFRTPEGLDVRVTMDANGTHYRGRFRSSDGHSGRVSGRRVSGCG